MGASQNTEKHQVLAALSRFMAVAAIMAVLAVAVPVGAGATVGVYPSAHDLGTVERGETVPLDLLLVGGDEGTNVKVTPVEPLTTDFDNRPRPYTFEAANASQESTVNWIDASKTPITLNAPHRFRIDGRTVTGNNELTYLLHIPEDAEPGYHLGVLLPELAGTDGEGLGIGTNAVSRHKIAFKVPGKAVRGARILGFNSKRISPVTVELYSVVRNTGTVTETVTVSPTVHQNGTTDTLGETGGRIGPGDIETFRFHWQPDNLTTGEYNVSATASWITGNASRDGTVQVAAYKPTVTGQQVTTGESGKEQIPFSIISTIAVVIVVYAVWRRRTNKQTTTQQ